jgi:hypothetical protein
LIVFIRAGAIPFKSISAFSWIISTNSLLVKNAGGGASNEDAVPHKAEKEANRERVLVQVTARPVTSYVTLSDGTEKVSQSLDNKLCEPESFSASIRKRLPSSVSSFSAHSIINRFGLSRLNLAWSLAFAAGTIEAESSSERAVLALHVLCLLEDM